MVAMKEGIGHIPAVLCTTLLPGLLVLFFVTHYDLLLQNVFRTIKLVVCCHEGRGSKMAEVCAFRQILPCLDWSILTDIKQQSLCAERIVLE